MAQALSQASQGLTGPTDYDTSDDGNNLTDLQAMDPSVSPSNNTTSSMSDRKLLRQDNTVVTI